MPKFEEVVLSAEQLMGVKAVWGRSSEPVMCFGSHGDPSLKNAGHFSLARRTAEQAVERPYLLTIGGGAQVGADIDGRVLELVGVSKAYGETKAFVRDPDLLRRLEQWPVAVVLTEVYSIEGEPSLTQDLHFEDRRILANAYDGIRRDDERVDRLWEVLRSVQVHRRWDVRRLPGFREPLTPRLCGSEYPRIIAASPEGKRIREEVTRLERTPLLAREVKDLNRTRNGGVIVCEACGLADPLAALFDAHHRDPLLSGPRISQPDMFAVLCPTCHRWSHAKAPSVLEPLTPNQVREARRSALGEPRSIASN